MNARYWFARRFPVSDPRNAMSPVSPEGFRVAWTFVGWMVGGAIAAAALAALGIWVPLAWVLAPVAFVGFAAYGGWRFISQTQNHGDTQHTVEDYRMERVN